MDELKTCHQVLMKVTKNGRSLEAAIQEVKSPYTQQVCYGVCRHYFSLKNTLRQLLDKPLPAKHLDIEVLLLIALYQLKDMYAPDHAVVNTAVGFTKTLRKNWAKSLVNAVLRNYQRQKEQLEANTSIERESDTDHPLWLLDKLQQSWPTQLESILAANNHQAPLTLRINPDLVNRDSFITVLISLGLEASPTQFSTTGVRLVGSTDITKLPGFNEGHFAVQDESAQFAAPLLDLVSGQEVLDACAAPGGKSCHIASYADISLTAIDVDSERMKRVAENISRLAPQAKVELITVDVFNAGKQFSGTQFDRILLDAPCSATGVIRRHPDIKLLRRESDIAKLAQRQFDMLMTLWPLLKPGGRLLYATCSILPEENEAVISRFLKAQSDAAATPISMATGIPQDHGLQILPERGGADGFYYARLNKMSNAD